MDAVPQVLPLRVKRVPSDPSISPSVISNGDSSHLDDLMFMLKTQSYPHDGSEPPLFDSDNSLKKPSGSEHLELRRISIADTHL